MSISFNLIPADIRTPGQYIEIDNSKAFQGLSGMPTKVLVIGQKLPSGTQEPLEPVLITNKDQARQLFGAGSQLSHMMAAFLNANDYTPVYAMAQNDAESGVAATGAIEITGMATKSGMLNLMIGGRSVACNVSTGMNGAGMATALVTAIMNNPDLSVIAEIDGDVPAKINLTAHHKGLCGCDLDIRFNDYDDQSFPDGVSATITPMTGGTGNPDVSEIIDHIGDEWYTDIVLPYTDSANLAVIVDEMESRFGPMRMREGHVYGHISGTHGQLIAKGLSLNSPHLTLTGSYGSPTPPYEWASVVAAVCAYQLKLDPARPVQTCVLPGIKPPKIKDRFTRNERNMLLFNGISTFDLDPGGRVMCERIITTYRENAFGAADPSYLDIETLKTVSYLRYDIRNFIALAYPRHKLASDGTNFARGQNVVTPSVIKASLIARFKLWEEKGLVENLNQFKRELIVERDASDPNRINALIPPDIVNQLRVFAGLVQLRL